MSSTPRRAFPVVAVLVGAVLLLAGSAQGTTTVGSPGVCSRTVQLAYVASQYAGEKGMVWLADANGSGRRRLVRAATPELSPSGGMIAVTDGGHGAGLEIFTVCGGRVGTYFKASDAITGVVWAPDSSLVTAIVDPHPNGGAFDQRLVVIDVATGHLTTVATEYLAYNSPSFSPAEPYQLVYDIDRKVGGNFNLWTAAIGQPSVQLTSVGNNEYPLWGPHGILYVHEFNSGLGELDLSSGGRSAKLMPLNGWPVALSSDGEHLAAEGAACGVVWPLSVNLTTRKVVHRFANGFAPFGISPSGGSLLIAGSPPSGMCGGKNPTIETVPFGGGRPTVIGHGTDPSWSSGPAVSAQAFHGNG